MSRRFKTGELVDAYRIEGFLGAGGMGEVYLGKHTRLERYAAIKVLNLSRMQSSLSARFQNEARLQSSLHHPNIATLYDFKEIGNRLFIFMEYVDGECLEDLIDRRFFSVEESLLVFYSIVEAVSFVHSSGVIHRDLKSQNIKLTSEGIPKLLDFGIAKDSQSSKLTKTGGVIGTPNYIAPEQLAGAKASTATDVWALGVLLYEMLAGEMPFQSGNIGELCEKIKRGDYPPIESRNPAVPRAVAKITERCLQKEPSRRFQNAYELSMEVSHLLKQQYGISAKSSDAIRKLFDTGHRYSISSGEKGNTAFFGITDFRMASLLSLFLIFVLVSLVGVWAFSHSDFSSNNSVIENSLEPKKSPNIVLPTVGPEKSPETSESDIEISSSEENERTIKIDVFEGSADVIHNGRVIGKTPYDLTVDEGSIINLILRREGFEDENVRIEAVGFNNIYTYSLKRTKN